MVQRNAFVFTEEAAMPDVWTKHPEIVRSLLEEGGFTCGVAPRILKGRDPAWTCIVGVST